MRREDREKLGNGVRRRTPAMTLILPVPCALAGRRTHTVTVAFASDTTLLHASASCRNDAAAPETGAAGRLGAVTCLGALRQIVHTSRGEGEGDKRGQEVIESAVDRLLGKMLFKVRRRASARRAKRVRDLRDNADALPIVSLQQLDAYGRRRRFARFFTQRLNASVSSAWFISGKAPGTPDAKRIMGRYFSVVPEGDELAVHLWADTSTVRVGEVKRIRTPHGASAWVLRLDPLSALDYAYRHALSEELGDDSYCLACQRNIPRRSFQRHVQSKRHARAVQHFLLAACRDFAARAHALDARAAQAQRANGQLHRRTA